jgi:Mrp family chromosome partitioning ATPase
MEPIDYAGALRRSWRLLVLLALVGAVIGVLIPVSAAKGTNGKKHPLKYQASALVGSAPKGSNFGAGVTSQQIQFYADSLALQGLVFKAARQNVPQFLWPEYLSATITTSFNTAQTTSSSTTPPKRGQATLVLLTAYGKTANDAITLADNYAGELAFYLSGQIVQEQKQSGTTTKGSTSSVNTNPYTGYEIQQYAEVATRIKGAKAGITSSRKVRALAGLVIGALIGAAIVLLREPLDKHLRSASRAEANFGFPVVSEIPLAMGPSGRAAAGTTPMVDVVRQPESPGAEAYRMLRMSVLFEALAPLPVPEDPLGATAYGAGSFGTVPVAADQTPAGIGDRALVLVVSAGSEPSRPHVAANLAAIYAEAGQQVVVISTGNIGTGSPTAGSGSDLADIRIEDVARRLQPSRLANVYRLPLGSFIANSGQLVTRAPSLLKAVRRLVDVVIVETPPVLAVHHAEALSHAVDVVLVVAECGVTTFDEARRAGDRLRRIEAPVLGVVLTNVKVPRNDISQMVPNQPGPQAPQPPQPAPPTRTKEPALAIGAGSGSSTAPTPPSSA